MAPVLGYWDIRGFASTIRNLLHYKEVDFVDKVYQIGAAPEYNIAGWLADKQTLGFDFPNVPYYIDGEIKLTQSLTILRYLARKHDLVGTNETETLRIELAEQLAVDLRGEQGRLLYFNPNFENDRDNNYEKDRVEYLKKLPVLINEIEKFLGNNKWVLGDRITYADFLLYDALDFHRLFDPNSFNDAAIANEFLTRFENIHQIKAYMTSGKYNKLACWAPVGWTERMNIFYFDILQNAQVIEY